MGNTFYFEWEPLLMAWIQGGLGDFGVKIMSFFSMLGEETIMVAVFAFVYYIWDKKAGVFIGINLMMIQTVNPLLKNIFLRRRPYFDHENVKCLKPVDPDADIYDISAQGYSFPSGHSNNAAGFYGSIAAYFKKSWMWIAASLLAVLVGISRFSVGVHYPTDVLAGWACGILIVIAVSILDKKIQKRWLLFLILTLLAVPGWFYCKSNDYYSGFGMMAGFFVGVLFEEKYVHFKVSRVWYRAILRILIGGGLYFGLNKLLKLPFSKELLESATMPQYIIRACRYFIIAFLLAAVFPISFKILDRVEEKKKTAKEAKTEEVSAEEKQE